MDMALVLKALADETRLKLLTLLLERSYCVRALSRKLGVTEAAVSQHLKVLRAAALVTGEREGRFTHYSVERETLRSLAGEIESLAAIERSSCGPEHGHCAAHEAERCRRSGQAGGCDCHDAPVKENKTGGNQGCLH